MCCLCLNTAILKQKSIIFCRFELYASPLCLSTSHCREVQIVLRFILYLLKQMYTYVANYPFYNAVKRENWTFTTMWYDYYVIHLELLFYIICKPCYSTVKGKCENSTMLVCLSNLKKAMGHSIEQKNGDACV